MSVVVYEYDMPVGVFDGMEQAAEYMGVKVESAQFMSTPTYLKRYENAKRRRRWLVVKV